jgi:hypothetical protein
VMLFIRSGGPKTRPRFKWKIPNQIVLQATATDRTTRTGTGERRITASATLP